jgi:hypothetical protein
MNAIGTMLKSSLLPGTLILDVVLRVDLSLCNEAKGLRIANATICTTIVHLWLQGQQGNLSALGGHELQLVSQDVLVPRFGCYKLLLFFCECNLISISGIL